jgi:hypothetical protein
VVGVVNAVRHCLDTFISIKRQRSDGRGEDAEERRTVMGDDLIPSAENK